MNNIAHPSKRLLAYALDTGINLIVPSLLIYNMSLAQTPELLLARLGTLLIFVIFVYPIIYSAFTSGMISLFGGTVGKLLTGTKIVSNSGEGLTFWRAFFRNRIAYMISGIFLWLGFIWVLVDKQRRAWHDQIAGTYVITTNAMLWVLGLVLGVLLFFGEYRLVESSVNNFMANQQMYSELGESIKYLFADNSDS